MTKSDHCTDCDRDMLDPETRGCRLSTFTFVVGSMADEDNPDEIVVLTQIYPRRTVEWAEGSDGESYRCSDCNALEANFHHAGCEVERCPRCGKQAISCHCQRVGEGES